MKIEDMINKIFLETSGNFEYLKQIPYNSIDLIFIDPPYLTTSEDWDKKEIITEQLSKEFYRILKDTGNFYCWCGIGEKSQSLIRWFPIFNKNFIFKDLLTWKKQRGMGMRKGWLYTREEIMWFVKDNKQFIWNKEEQYSKTELRKIEKLFTGKEAKSKYKRLTNVFTDISEQNIVGQKNPIKTHFTSKPLEILERIIKVHTKKKDIILDCFMGSGSIAVACKRLNRNFIGMEIYQNYIDNSYNRLKEVKQGEGLDDRNN
jgi:site-specific DNA-methyltransferase (adenine-specific)